MDVVANGMRAVLVIVLGGSLVAAMVAPEQVFGPEASGPQAAADDGSDKIPCLVGTDPSCVGPEATQDEVVPAPPPPVVAVPPDDDDGDDDGDYRERKSGKKHRDRHDDD